MTRLRALARSYWRYHGLHRGTRTRVARDHLIPREWLLRCAEHVKDDTRSLLPAVDPWPGAALFEWADAWVGA